MITIAFHDNQLTVRGTSQAIYDYAHYNELLLKNKSIIICPYSSIDQNRNDNLAITKFMSRFKVFFYKNQLELDHFLIVNNVNIFYCIKYGTNDGIITANTKNVIHCVFNMSEPHGDVYAAVSESIAKKFGKELYVPHMISLQPSTTFENLRNELNIPLNATVFGRYGGSDVFELKIAHDVIKKIVNENENIYFVFINTPNFYNHSQIIYMDKIITNNDKNKFICTLDAYIECSEHGHSWGLSIGEHSINNKPIIAYSGWMLNREHLNILGDKGIYWKTQDEFYNILTTFDKSLFIGKDLNAYKNYTPENVMHIFKQVFIE